MSVKMLYKETSIMAINEASPVENGKNDE